MKFHKLNFHHFHNCIYKCMLFTFIDKLPNSSSTFTSIYSFIWKNSKRFPKSYRCSWPHWKWLEIIFKLTFLKMCSRHVPSASDTICHGTVKPNIHRRVSKDQNYAIFVKSCNYRIISLHVPYHLRFSE